MEKLIKNKLGQWDLVDESLNKAYVINPNVPKGTCDCGAHKTGSHAHSDWCSGLKTSSGYSFQHVKHDHVNDPSNAGPIDYHHFHIFEDGKHIGSVKARHESDNLEQEGLSLNNRNWDDSDTEKHMEVEEAFEKHLNDNYKKYMDMSPTYGKTP